MNDLNDKFDQFRATSPDNPEDLARSATLTLFWVLAFGICIGGMTSLYMGIASCSYALMIAGLKFRKTREIHVPVMTVALATDISLVLILELSRHAINTSVSGSLSMVQHAHIISSTLAILLYIPLVALGYRLFQRRSSELSRSMHLRLGVLAFLFRSAGFILMFSMLNVKN